MAKFAVLAASLWLAVIGSSPAAYATEHFITLASTTSTENSGLFAHLLPKFTRASGIGVRVIAVGTGAALRLGRRGDVDVVLVHARAAEDSFIAEGAGIMRRDVMFNDFVLIGGALDPAGIGGSNDAVAALGRIAASRSAFVSRGDNSGTHMAELRLWRATRANPKAGSGKWYFEAGAGMGTTLNIAAGRDAYVLADRASWLAFKNRARLRIVVEGDKRLHNPYGVMMVNPARHGHVKRNHATAFIEWLTGAEGRAAIASFRLGGRQVFFPASR